MTKEQLFNMVYSGKEHKGYFTPAGFKYVGTCFDQCAQYSVYQNSTGEIIYSRYADMD